MAELTQLSILELAEALAAGQTTSLAITNAYLARIDRLNPDLNAYLTVFHETAREQAKASDERRASGKTLGQLDGIPLAVKDNLMSKGQRTTAASKILDDYRAHYDATVIKNLKAAGAVILGKTNLDEFAMGSSTEHSAYGPSKNPWDMSRVPGGSSGGSAVAVAANLCAGALGSDTFGSIRLPASFCGVVGLKPTYGLVSRYGLIAMASSLDVVGPMTKTVADAKLLLAILAGQDPYDATTLNETPKAEKLVIEQVTIGIPKEYFGEGMDQRVNEAVMAAVNELKKLGAKVVDVTLPSSQLAVPAYYTLCPVEVASNMARYDGIRYGASVERDGAKHTIAEVMTKTRAGNIGPEVKRRIMLGTYASSAGYYDAYYAKAMKVRALIKAELDAVFETVDILATPVSPSLPFRFGEKTSDPLAMYLEDINTGPVNLAGLPAISVPAGLVTEDDHQLPVGLQLIGPRLGDAMVCTVAAAYEQVTSWRDHQPSLIKE